MSAQLPLRLSPPDAGAGDPASVTGGGTGLGNRTTDSLPIPCAGCGGKIPRPRPNKRFCSDDCRWQAWDREHPRANRDTAEASRRRDEGIARVEENAGAWLEDAGEALGRLVETFPGKEAPWDHLKALLLVGGLRKPHHPNAWGGLVRRAVKAGWLTRVGYTTASSPQSHGTEMRVYRVRGGA